MRQEQELRGADAGRSWGWSEGQARTIGGAAAGRLGRALRAVRKDMIDGASGGADAGAAGRKVR